jgi:hypothetical protein
MSEPKQSISFYDDSFETLHQRLRPVPITRIAALNSVLLSQALRAYSSLKLITLEHQLLFLELLIP